MHPPRLTNRRALIAFLAVFAAWWVCLAMIVIWLAYPRVPRGVDNSIAFESFAEDAPPLISPDGKWRLRVRFNDAGGMHSGHHWTWIIDKDRNGWEYILCQGYSAADVRYGERALPVHWIDDETLEIQFADGRYSRTYVTQSRQRAR